MYVIIVYKHICGYCSCMYVIYGIVPGLYAGVINNYESWQCILLPLVHVTYIIILYLVCNTILISVQYVNMEVY